MKIYVEYKKCYLTIVDYKLGYLFDWTPSILEFDNMINKFGYKLTNDYKFIYLYINGKISRLKITNISSKPITTKESKIQKYIEIQKEINELNREKEKLFIRRK